LGDTRLLSDEIQEIQRRELQRKPKKKKKKRPKFKTISIRVPSSLHRKLKKRAVSVGCSVSSLVKNWINDRLEGVVYTESYRQTATVSKTVQHEKKFTTKVKKAPANYHAPPYFEELKKVMAQRKKRKVKS
jgi:predicted DNA-binding protein